MHDRFRSRLGPWPGQHVRAARAGLLRHLRGVEDGELRPGQLDDARRGVRLHLRRAPGLAVRPGGCDVAAALRAVWPGGRAARGAAVRQPRLQRLADGHGRGRHHRRQQRGLHLRQGAARPCAALGERVARDRRPARLDAAARDTGGGNRARGGAARVFQKGKTGQGDARRGAERGRRAPDGHQRAARDHGGLRALHALRRRRRHHDRAALQRALRHGHAVRPEGVRGGDPRRHHQRLGRDAGGLSLRRGRAADHRAARLGLYADPDVHAGDRGARADAERALGARGAEKGMKALAFLVAFAAAIAFTATANSYYVFIMATLALTAIAGVGLNVLLGLTGQVSFGHVGFYALGAYTVAVLTVPAKWSFWAAAPVAALIAGAIGALLALPAMRVRGPYLAMVTIAFGFVVENLAIEWRSVSGGQNGIMGVPQPSLFGFALGERGVAIAAIVLAAAATYGFHLLSRTRWGAAMRAVKDSEVAAESIGLDPLRIKTAAFAISAVCAGVAGALFAPLSGFVTPSSFTFSQSLLFVLVVIIGGAGSLAGPLVGAAIVVLLPEALAALAEYRLLFFGALLLAVLLLAPDGLPVRVPPPAPRAR